MKKKKIKKIPKITADRRRKDILETAKFYFLSSRYDEAISEFKKALVINPGNAEAYYNLGLIYEHQNKKEEAKGMYEKALAIDADYKLAREHLNKLIGI